MKHYFSDIEASANDIYEMYNNFLKENHLDEVEELKFPSERAFTARFEDSNYILAKYGKKYRYYNIEECDVETLVNELHLNQFMDVEISTMKLFVENKTLILLLLYH